MCVFFILCHLLASNSLFFFTQHFSFQLFYSDPLCSAIHLGLFLFYTLASLLACSFVVSPMTLTLFLYICIHIYMFVYECICKHTHVTVYRSFCHHIKFSYFNFLALQKSYYCAFQFEEHVEYNDITEIDIYIHYFLLRKR